MNSTINKESASDFISEMKIASENALDKATETSAEFSEKALLTIKKYPLHTAVIAGAVAGVVGLIAGAKISRK